MLLGISCYTHFLTLSFCISTHYILYKYVKSTWPSYKKTCTFVHSLIKRFKLYLKQQEGKRTTELKLRLSVCSICSLLILKRIHESMSNDEKSAINTAQFVCYDLTLQNMPQLIRSKN